MTVYSHTIHKHIVVRQWHVYRVSVFLSRPAYVIRKQERCLAAAIDPAGSWPRWTFAMTLHSLPALCCYHISTYLLAGSEDTSALKHTSRVHLQWTLYSKSSLKVKNGRGPNKQGLSNSSELWLRGGSQLLMPHQFTEMPATLTTSFSSIVLTGQSSPTFFSFARNGRTGIKHEFEWSDRQRGACSREDAST